MVSVGRDGGAVFTAVLPGCVASGLWSAPGQQRPGAGASAGVSASAVPVPVPAGRAAP